MKLFILIYIVILIYIIYFHLYCFFLFSTVECYYEQLLIDKGKIKIYNIVYTFMKFEGKREKIQNYRNEARKKYSQRSFKISLILLCSCKRKKSFP